MQEMNQLDTDTYLGEIKFENSIDPLTGEANPRQIERVPAGTVFKFCLVYDLANKDEVQEDMETLKDGIRLLEWDYLGGNGSRGYGRVHFENWESGKFHLSSGFGSNGNPGAVSADFAEIKEVGYEICGLFFRIRYPLHSGAEKWGNWKQLLWSIGQIPYLEPFAANWQIMEIRPGWNGCISRPGMANCCFRICSRTLLKRLEKET